MRSNLLILSLLIVVTGCGTPAASNDFITSRRRKVEVHASREIDSRNVMIRKRHHTIDEKISQPALQSKNKLIADPMQLNVQSKHVPQEKAKGRQKVINYKHEEKVVNPVDLFN